MPPPELLRIALGLNIPPLPIAHALRTRLAFEIFGRRPSLSRAARLPLLKSMTPVWSRSAIPIGPCAFRVAGACLKQAAATTSPTSRRAVGGRAARPAACAWLPGRIGARRRRPAEPVFGRSRYVLFGLNVAPFKANSPPWLAAAELDLGRDALREQLQQELGCEFKHAIHLHAGMAAVGETGDRVTQAHTLTVVGSAIDVVQQIAEVEKNGATARGGGHAAGRVLLIRHKLFMKRHRRRWGHRNTFSPAPVFAQASSCARSQQP